MPYFDHAASTKPYDAVVDLISETMKNDFYNPASLYKPAKDLSRKMAAAYNNVANNLNCSATELIQTSGATESTNMAFKGLYSRYGHRLKKIIASSADHDASLNTLKYLKTKGAEVVLLDPDKNGLLNLSELEDVLDENTLLVSILYVNNETGVVQDLNKLSHIIRKNAPQAYIHADLVQALGKVKIDLKELDIDLASFSGHKIHGPKSSGLLYIRDKVYPEALIHGGGQQNGLRSGTEDWPLLSGLSLSVELACRNIDINNEKVWNLRQKLLPKLIELGAIVNFPNSIPQILSVSFPKYRAETLLHMLEANEIYLSTSSACNAKSSQISHVLQACKMNREQAEGTLRISLDQSNTEEEIDELIEVFRRIIKQMEDWGM